MRPFHDTPYLYIDCPSKSDEMSIKYQKDLLMVISQTQITGNGVNRKSIKREIFKNTAK